MLTPELTTGKSVNSLAPLQDETLSGHDGATNPILPKQKATIFQRARVLLSEIFYSQDEWERALYEAKSASPIVQRRGYRRAKRLYNTNTQVKEVSSNCFFNFIDILCGHDRPQRESATNKETDNNLSARKRNKLKNEAKLDRLLSNLWETFDMAVSCGLNCNQQHQNQYGDTALHRAAVAGNIDLIKALIKGGALINARDWNSYTPMASALSNTGPISGNQERRSNAALALIAMGGDVTLGRKQSNSETNIERESGLLACMEDNNDRMIDFVKNGASIEWGASPYNDDDIFIPGDLFNSGKDHAFFLFDNILWKTPNQPKLNEWLDTLIEKGTDPKTLRSSVGFTPAMGLLLNGSALANNLYASTNDEKERENLTRMVNNTLNRLISKGFFDPMDKSEGGSNIWHALFARPNEWTSIFADIIIDRFPETLPLLTEKNDSGVCPQDILEYLKDGSPGTLETSEGKKFEAPRINYGESWTSTLDYLASFTRRAELEKYAAPNAALRKSEPRQTIRM